MFSFFFYNRKPRSFEHKPIFYDARKEGLNEHISKMEAELNLNDSEKEFLPSIKGSFFREAVQLKKEKKKKRKYNLGVFNVFIHLLFLIVLFIVSYYLLFY